MGLTTVTGVIILNTRQHVPTVFPFTKPFFFFQDRKSTADPPQSVYKSYMKIVQSGWQVPKGKWKMGFLGGGSNGYTFPFLLDSQKVAKK